MGYHIVYKTLEEIFPEVDFRVLKAVAIENQNDVDAAVEVVLTKVMPCINARSRSSSSPNPSRTNVQSPNGSSMDDSETCGQQRFALKNATPGQQRFALKNATRGQQRFALKNATHGQQNVALKNVIHGQQNVARENATHLDEEKPGQFYDAECDHEQLLNDVNDSIHQLSRDSRVDSSKKDQNGVPVSFDLNVADQNGTDFGNETLRSDSPNESLDLPGPETPEINLFPLKKRNSASFASLQVEDGISSICSNGSKSEVENFEGHYKQCSPEVDNVHFVSSTEVPISNLVIEPFSPKSPSVESNFDNLFAANIELSTPVQICYTDLLEDDIALERNKKKTLFTSLQSVINLMKEVELEESVTADAKTEASKGGLDTLQKAEDLKKLLQHAKEANEMHAGEVNGEKAILVTEVKELQTRLITLSDETDKSLGILNEMRLSLEARLVVANNEREAAEKEKLEKEAIAKKELADQDLIMEKVVQEANILKKQAEENAKLREFLVERGHVADALQGEISVICQDVILLKKQFDEHLPLSESLTSSQTSCILASSNSSVKNIAPVLVDPVNISFEEEDEVKTKGLSSSWGSSYAAERQTSETEAAAIDNHKEASDEGWELLI